MDREQIFRKLFSIARSPEQCVLFGEVYHSLLLMAHSGDKEQLQQYLLSMGKTGVVHELPCDRTAILFKEPTNFAFLIVWTSDARFAGYISRYLTPQQLAAPNPLDFGCQEWMPELATSLQTTPNDLPVREFMVQPRSTRENYVIYKFGVEP